MVANNFIDPIFLGQAVEIQVYTLAISQVHRFCSSTTTSYLRYLSSLFLRDYRLVTSFIFSRYSYREEAVQFAYSSLLIRLSSIELIGYILASKESIFSSTYIWGLRCSSYSSAQVRNKIFTAIQSSISYLRLIRASARLVAPSLYIIRKLN